jgi:hypothetical protein
MLRVIVEIVPGGYRELRRSIASMAIANISDLASISDYRVEGMESANHLAGTPSRSATCTVHGHDRRQSVWALIAKAAAELEKAEFDEL